MTAPERSEWAANWPLLLSAVIGIPVAVAMSAVASQFMAPLEHEFGWTRSQASIGYSLSMIFGIITSPLIGRLVDKVNARWLALSGVVLTGLAIAAFTFTTSSMALWIGLWCAAALAGALCGPTVWLAVVSSAFEKNRSLAISITISGMAIATTFAPISGRLLIDAVGWRMAWVWLGVVWSVPALILALLFFHDRRPAVRVQPVQAQQEVPKPLLRQAMRSGTFIRLAVATTVFGLAGASFMFHMFPALTDKGLDAKTAATVAGVFGLALIPGKLAMGTVFDRVGQLPVTLGLTALLAMASAILAQHSANVPLAVAGCVLLGLASGGFQVALPCFLTRLFDPSIFGSLYGLLTSMSVLAAAIGPLLVSKIHDVTGSYSIAFWGGIVVAGLVALLLAKLAPVNSPAAAHSRSS